MASLFSLSGTSALCAVVTVSMDANLVNHTPRKYADFVPMLNRIGGPLVIPVVYMMASVYSLMAAICVSAWAIYGKFGGIPVTVIIGMAVLLVFQHSQWFDAGVKAGFTQ